jgi:hypothetical protein
VETKNDILPTVKVEYMFIDALVRAIKRVAQSFITVGTKCKKDRILLLYESNSGSNTYALFKLVSDELNKKRAWRLGQQLLLYQPELRKAPAVAGRRHMFK